MRKSALAALGIIGYGKMGSSLIKGALRSGKISSNKIMVYDVDEKRMAAAKEDNLTTVNSISDLRSSQVIILAVKPNDMPLLLETIGKELPTQKILFISIAAGVRIPYMESKLGEDSRILRVMPNIAASVGEAASVFVPNRWVTNEDLVSVRSLLEGVGLAFMVEEESRLDVVTGISGSGPAYFFLLMKVLEEVGKKHGLDEELVKRLVAQTCKGAGALALTSKDLLDGLIRAVASPGGTTEKALETMESRGFTDIVSQAVSAAIERSREMGLS